MMAGWTMGLEGWLWMGAWALVLVVLVWLLVREPRRDPLDQASAILQARFARGEIDEEEFRRATAALAAAESRPTSPGSAQRAGDERTSSSGDER